MFEFVQRHSQTLCRAWLHMFTILCNAMHMQAHDKYNTLVSLVPNKQKSSSSKMNLQEVPEQGKGGRLDTKDKQGEGG